MSDSAETAYNLIRTTFKDGYLSAPHATNGLLLREQHQNGQILSQEQKGLVRQWLDLLYKVDPSQPQLPPSKTYSEALEFFTGCMDFNTWDARELDTISDTPVQTELVGVVDTCTDCHNAAIPANQRGNLLLDGNDDEGTFAEFQLFPSVTKLVTANGFPFQSLVYAPRLEDKGGEYDQCIVDQALLDIIQNNQIDDDPNYCHPNYTLDNVIEEDLEDFVGDTIAISNQENCIIEDL